MDTKSLFNHMHLQWFAEEQEETEQEATEEAQTEQTESTEKEELSLESLKGQLEQLKKAQAGSDRAYQQAKTEAESLRNENEELKKERMSDKEKAEYELQQREEALKQKESEIKNAELKVAKMKLMDQAGLSHSFLDWIPGQNEEEVSENLNAFGEHLEKEVQKRVEQEIENRFGGKRPPKSAERSGEVTYQDLLNMSDEEQRQYTPQQVQEIINKG